VTVVSTAVALGLTRVVCSVVPWVALLVCLRVEKTDAGLAGWMDATMAESTALLMVGWMAHLRAEKLAVDLVETMAGKMV